MSSTVSTANPRAPVVARDEVPIESVQPGGGFCFDWALRWGRLRRAILRTLRPDYVRRMAELRQGECPGCVHDVIDPRDLEPFRNTCGYSFREDDDRFRWRARLGVARAGLPELTISTGACLVVGVPFALAAASVHPAFWCGVVAIFAVWVQMVWFFRDPPRTPPDDPLALVSPADGRVTHVHEVDDPDFPGGRAARISIYLSPWNVHLNRNPRTARVVATRYFPGAFITARDAECVVRNEQLWVDLEEPNGRRIRVKQVSGAMARRIVCWLAPGQTVRVGGRFGIIKYGSRTDVLLPVDSPMQVVVEVGDRVASGTTILVRFAEGA